MRGGQRILWLLWISLSFPVLAGQPVLANGSKGKLLQYLAEVSLDQQAKVRFSATLDSRLVLLTSLRNKYKVIRIRIDNTRNGKAILLSKTADSLEIFVPLAADRAQEVRVKGILDLAGHDPSLWDDLDAETRKVLVYPQSVPAREEESVFVFIPDDALKVIPGRLIYTIESLSGKKVEIREPPATAR